MTHRKRLRVPQDDTQAVLCMLRMQTFQEEFFYAWTYDRPMSPWTYLLSGLAVVVVMLCCLFPLAPYPVCLLFWLVRLSASVYADSGDASMAGSLWALQTVHRVTACMVPSG